MGVTFALALADISGDCCQGALVKCSIVDTKTPSFVGFDAQKNVWFDETLVKHQRDVLNVNPEIEMSLILRFRVSVMVKRNL